MRRLIVLKWSPLTWRRVSFLPRVLSVKLKIILSTRRFPQSVIAPTMLVLPFLLLKKAFLFIVRSIRRLKFRVNSGVKFRRRFSSLLFGSVIRLKPAKLLTLLPSKKILLLVR